MSKLINIQRELVVIKCQFNKFGNYAYRSSEDILLALKPLLVKNECELIVTDDIQGIGEHVYIKATASLTCDSKTFTASSFARDGIVQKGMSSAQVTNSASSFAKKQALSNLFLIDDTAEVAPTLEEQVKIEKDATELKEHNEAETQKKIDDFLNESKTNIETAKTMEELKPIFGMTYRAANKMGVKVVEAVTEFYNNQKESLK